MIYRNQITHQHIPVVVLRNKVLYGICHVMAFLGQFVFFDFKKVICN